MSKIIRFEDFATLMSYARASVLLHGVAIGRSLLMPEQQMTLTEWCEDRFGPDAITRMSWSLDKTIKSQTYYYLNCDHKWTFSGNFFIFSKSDMAFEFKMRWG